MTIYYREYQCGDCDREFSETSEIHYLVALGVSQMTS